MARTTGLLGALVVFAVACGSSTSNELTGTSGAGGASATAGSETSGVLTGSTGTGSDEFAACASASLVGEPIPVTLFIMMDRSGSMLDNQKWANATTALQAFFQDPESAGLSVALRFFPDEQPVAGCSAPSCSVSACATPLVDAAALNAQPAYADPQQKALVDALKATSPGGQTPMHAALAGAEAWATAHAGSDHRTAVILLTDGEPQGCDENIDHIAQLAAESQSKAGVLTYVIGMVGSKQSQLDAIAKAGGSTAAFLIDKGTVTTELRAQLKKIKTAQLACTLELPASPDPTKPVDPELVNVTMAPKAGGVASTIPQVASKAACSGVAWYYDTPNAPAHIILCPAACTAAEDNPDTVVTVVLGCATKVL